MCNITKQKKILIIAEAANPEWVSVPLVGWSMAIALSNIFDVHIVTQERNKNAFIRAGLKENIDFTSINSEKFSKPIHEIAEMLRKDKGKAWTISTAADSLSYYYFEYLVWKKFKKELTAGKYDIVHRVTPLSPTAPSMIAKKCFKIRIPFIIGPINGGVPWPKEFQSERKKESEWLSYLRFLYKLLPGISTSHKYSSAIIVGSYHTKSEVNKKYHEKIYHMPENGIDEKKFHLRCNTLNIEKPIRAVFVGRLVPYKGPDIAIEACVEQIKRGDLILDIIGDGPMMKELIDKVDDLDIKDGVNFHGWVNHSNIQNILTNNNIFVFPSIREFGGGVVLEAMAVGLVPIIVDYAGPSELVTKETGIKIKLAKREYLIKDFKKEINLIVNNKELIKKMSNACIKTVNENHTWSAKSLIISRIYDACLNQKSKTK